MDGEDAVLERFAHDFRKLLAGCLQTGLSVDDVAEMAESVLQGPWEFDEEG